MDYTAKLGFFFIQVWKKPFHDVSNGTRWNKISATRARRLQKRCYLCGKIKHLMRDAYWIIAVMVFIMVFLLLTYVYVRKRFVREIAYRKRLVHSYEKELETQRQHLRQTKEKLERVTKEIDNYKTELRTKERLLEEKINQNKTFIKLLHQTELEDNAEDIIKAVRLASEGRHTLSEEEWKMLLHAVDEMYPTFNDSLIRKIGKVDRQELRVCYLIRIGLTNPKIQNITGLPRTTVWRWVKKYDWINRPQQ